MKNTTTTLKIITNIAKKNILNILFFLASLLLISFGQYNYNDTPTVIYFDVGQGDSILIQQDNYQILIDGGPGDSILFELPKYMPWYDNKIETIILTHPHADHIDGLMLVLQKYEVGKILYNPIQYENEAYNYLVEEYANILVPAKMGDTVYYKDIYLEVLYPYESYDYQEENVNNESIVALAEIDDYRLLFMGDAEQEIEEKMAEQYNLEDIYILKVGHHCSRTSTSEMFLTETSPDIAVCSLGSKNKFGHPHYETIEKFQAHDVQYLITAEEGNIRFRF